jgi:hypothetical protein
MSQFSNNKRTLKYVEGFFSFLKKLKIIKIKTSFELEQLMSALVDIVETHAAVHIHQWSRYRRNLKQYG